MKAWNTPLENFAIAKNKTKTMKKTLLFATLLGLLAACNPNKDQEVFDGLFFGDTEAAKPPANPPTPPVPVVDLAKGLVLSIPFNGTAQDVSGNGNHGLGSGGVSLTADRKGTASSACLFTETGSITVSNSATMQFQKASSWSVWINLTPAPGDNLPQNIFVKSGVLNAFAINAMSNTLFSIVYGFSGQSTVAIPNSRTDQWIHLVYVFDELAKTIKTYANGQIVATQTASFLHATSNTEILLLGRVSSNLMLKGKLDDFRVYNRLLSAEEVQALYKL